MYQKTVVETPEIVGAVPNTSDGRLTPKVSELVEGFLRYGQFELSFSTQTVDKYKECLSHIIRDIGDLPVSEITQVHLTELKQKVLMRGASEARVGSMVFAMKSFLRYCSDMLELPVLNYKKIKSPKRRRREVIYLTNEEVQQFIDCIKIENTSKKKTVRMDGLRFRTLVEVLLGTGMRISEALSLNRDSIDFQKKEAKIIGKGSKERTVFFSERSIDWIQRYMDARTDSEFPLFVTQQLTRLNKNDVSSLFRRYAKRSEIPKKITPHILRHTMATNLLFNGCPISHVKEILGHDRLETTCRYYLGLDKSKAKEAHNQFLNF